MFSQVSLILLN